MTNGLPVLPKGIDLVIGWPRPSESLQAEVVTFWRSESALSDRDRAESRAAELLVVAKTATGDVAAVSTARRVLVPVLDRKCFYYRTYVGKAFRTVGLASSQLVWALFTESYELLNRRHEEGHDTDYAGIYLEIDNESIKRNRNELVWSDMGMNVVYIGKTPQGHHARVWYFKNACIDPGRKSPRT